MDRPEIEDQVDRIEALADDDLLWPVALTWPVADACGWEEGVMNLRRVARDRQLGDLRSRVGQLWQRLNEYNRDPAYSEGQAITRFLQASTEREIEKNFYEYPYLRTDSAIRRLEKMAVRAQEVDLPAELALSVELICWKRAAAAGLLIGTNLDKETALQEVRRTASGLQAAKKESRLLGFIGALEDLGLQRGYVDPRAAEPFRTAARHGRALVKNRSTPENQLSQAITLRDLGIVEGGARQNYEQAEQALREAVSCLRSLVEADVPESRKMLADALLNLESSLSSQQRYGRAEEICQAAVRNCQILLEGERDTMCRRMLAKAFQKAGVHAHKQGKHKKSEQASMAAVVHYHVLFVEEKGTLDDRKRLARCLRDVGTTNLHHLGCHEKAEKFLQASVRHFRALFEKQMEGRKKLANVLRNLGESCLRLRSNKRAEEVFEEAIVHCRTLFEKHDASENIKSLALVNENCGIAKLRRQKFQDAGENFAAAAEHARSLCRADVEGAPRLLASACYHLGSAQIKQEKIQAAEESLQTAVDQTETLSPDASDFRDLEPQDAVRQDADYLRFRRSRWGSLYGLAFCQVYRSEQSESASEKHLRRARSYLEQARKEIKSERQKMSAFKQRRALREEWVHIYEHRRDIAHRLGNTEASLRWTIGSKARGLSELIKASRSDE